MCACAPNNAASSVDTESAPAAMIDVVGASADALAELIADPIFAKSAAAAWTNSGAAITNSMHDLPKLGLRPRLPKGVGARVSRIPLANRRFQKFL